MALPAFTSYTDPTEEDVRRLKRPPQESQASSMSAPTPSRVQRQQRTPAQEDALQRRMKKKPNLSQDPYQMKPQG
jgi:hypothetical protein